MTNATQQDGAVSRRRAHTDARLSEAVLQQLATHGYQALTIEGVSRQSGVAKTTIYRRWQSKAEMVFDLVIHRRDARGLTDSGSLAADIETLAGQVVDLIATEPGRSTLPGLLADMAGDPDLTSRLQQSVVAAVRADIEAMVDRASSRGEVRTGVDIDSLYAALLGVPYVHVHLLGQMQLDLLRKELTEVLLTLLAVDRRG
ncbi:TetR/AcrR family transcriptional regulator [Actinomyces viscosus]|uniref:Mycofactocin system transcriptional regulator n=1 Tax=Actinomyces viscosus TaxID=1656 RepID=A0A448PJJ1_ACTVI|nr:TetR/AcrR family transcriptional regulator [Actinomyces viscosus]TFH54058.1 TetR/AcrR family transcriptional regulator [Actinomyces viscosus]VEI15172.1 mycofactocin system transcriptional regulator [Actinomyces viscosus]